MSLEDRLVGLVAIVITAAVIVGLVVAVWFGVTRWDQR